MSNIPARDQAAPSAISWLFQSREEAQGVPLAAENGVSELRKVFLTRSASSQMH